MIENSVQMSMKNILWCLKVVKVLLHAFIKGMQEFFVGIYGTKKHCEHQGFEPGIFPRSFLLQGPRLPRHA